MNVISSCVKGDMVCARAARILAVIHAGGARCDRLKHQNYPFKQVFQCVDRHVPILIFSEKLASENPSLWYFSAVLGSENRFIRRVPQRSPERSGRNGFLLALFPAIDSRAAPGLSMVCRLCTFYSLKTRNKMVWCPLQSGPLWIAPQRATKPSRLDRVPRLAWGKLGSDPNPLFECSPHFNLLVVYGALPFTPDCPNKST